MCIGRISSGYVLNACLQQGGIVYDPNLGPTEEVGGTYSWYGFGKDWAGYIVALQHDADRWPQ